MDEIMIKIENVEKEYKLGEIGGTTLKEALQRFWAKIRKKEDPTRRIGAKNYNKGEKFKALNGVSFEVKKGEAIGLIGHNGAGKSTLLKLITRVTAPTKGKILLNGRVASMLEVGTGFHGELTGRENVYMNGAILGMTKKEIDAKIESIIDFSEVREFIDTPVKRYSSGMFVKLAFAVASHLDAEILLMDEVLAVGDMAFQNKCINKMKEVVSSGKTIIYVSHNMDTIRRLCNKTVVLQAGKVVFEGAVEAGIARYLNIDENVPSVEFDLTKMSHITEATLDFEMKALKLGNKIQPIYSNDESLVLNFKMLAKCDLEHVRYRMIIRTEEDFIIGTSFSKEFSVKKGTINLSLSFNLANLVPNKYYVSISFVQMLDNGDNKMLDHIQRAFSFELLRAESIEYIWFKKTWGLVRLEESKLLTNNNI